MSCRTPLLRRTAAALLVAATSFVALPALAAETSSASSSSARATSLGDNAALRYWPAFHFLPKRSAEQEKMLEGWRATAAKDPDAAALIQAGDRSLRYLHDGAALPRAEWGLDYSQGFGLLLPQAGECRNLARLACLRAHERALAGDSTGAVDDLADAMAMGQHLSSDPILIVLLVRDAIDSMATDTAADHLLQLKGPALEQFAARLDHMPAGTSAVDTVRTEQEFGQKWAAKEVRSWAGKPDAKQRMLAMFASPEDPNSKAEVERAIEAGGGTAEGVAAKLESLAPVYDELAAALKLPHEQAHKRIDEVREKAMGANPFAGLLLPSYNRALDVEARTTTRLAMLKAAIAIVQGGPDKLKDFKDPFGTGPFEYKPADSGGFELRSKLTVNDGPVTLRVGMPVEAKK